MPRPSPEPTALSPIDFHVLLVLAGRDLYGYAIMKAVEEESGGALTPEIGFLYRVLGRLTGAGLVTEAEGRDEAEESHRGRPRRYYGITPAGRLALDADARRLEAALDLVRRRGALPQGSAR
jgi:DNA-binding PadR family transcriptional regulator